MKGQDDYNNSTSNVSWTNNWCAVQFNVRTCHLAVHFQN